MAGGGAPEPGTFEPVPSNGTGQASLKRGVSASASQIDALTLAQLPPEIRAEVYLSSRMQHGGSKPEKRQNAGTQQRLGAFLKR